MTFGSGGSSPTHGFYPHLAMGGTWKNPSFFCCFHSENSSQQFSGWWWLTHNFLFSPLVKSSNLTNAHIFQMGWFNHQLVFSCCLSLGRALWAIPKCLSTGRPGWIQVGLSQERKHKNIGWRWFFLLEPLKKILDVQVFCCLEPATKLAQKFHAVQFEFMVFQAAGP